MILKLLKTFLPWLVTVAALYWAFRDVELSALVSHFTNADPLWIAAAVALTSVSYLMRARRWQYLFPTALMDYGTAARVLILGFFMNNILPARAGELVRAHIGGKATGETRTLVLATIASERLADGFTLSLFFVVAALGLREHPLSEGLTQVASFFIAAMVGVGLFVMFREHFFELFRRIDGRIDTKASNYTFNRLQVFIDGLLPLFSLRKAPVLTSWSIIIWSIELLVYYVVGLAFGESLTLPVTILFMVTVNFASLIPAAPGGLGVIEAMATMVLVSLGMSHEHALAMALCQHAVQIAVVGIPGAAVMLTWRRDIVVAEGKTA